MCRFIDLWRLTLPEAVSLKRFTAPRLLLSFARALGFLIVFFSLTAPAGGAGAAPAGYSDSLRGRR
jgi:hypothetical protein